MSDALMGAVLAAAVSVALLRYRLGRTWLRRPGTLLILVSAACQVLPAVLLSFPLIAVWDTSRKGILPVFTDQATLIMSAGMLALAVAYLMAGPERSASELKAPDPRLVTAVLDWRWLILAAAPLAVLTYQGRGYNNAAATTTTTPLVTVLASTFFILAVVLAAFSLTLRHGRFLLVLAAQSLVLAAAGERTPVLAAAVALVLLLCHAGKRPQSSQLHAAVALTVVAVLAITGLRAEQGRQVFYEHSGLGGRAAALTSGLSGLSGSPGSPPLIAQAAARLDGDAFAGGVLQAVSTGYPRLPATDAAESLLLPVPSALWADKAGQGTALNPVLLEMNDFGLQRVNFLPGMAGLYIGFLSWPWLLMLLAIFGAVAGRAERWLMGACTPARLVLLGGAVIAVGDYQAGLPGMLVSFRPAATVAAGIWVLTTMRARRYHPVTALR
jgi:hypothetical protein